MSNNRPPEIAILIACSNEEATIIPCLEAVQTAMPSAEILVMAGGTDRTAEHAEKLAAQHSLIRVVRHIPDHGKGHAIRDAIALARAPVMAQFDADLQFDAADLPALLAPVQAGQLDVCIGSRALRGSVAVGHSSIWREVGNRFLALWVTALTGQRVTDVTTGMKAWHRAAMAQIDFRDEAYSYEVEIVVRAIRLGLRLGEIPVRYHQRQAGHSMHRHTGALARAGAVIAWKSMRARFRQAR